MADNLSLSASRRETRGKGNSRKMRRAGFVPGVVYGREMAPITISVPARELLHILRLPDFETELIDMKIDDGDSMDVLIKEAQLDHVGQRLLHIDFFRIRRGQKVIVDVPIVTAGIAVGVKAGGLLQHNMRMAKIRCLPRNLIHEIEVDITSLELGDSVHVRDLDLPEGIEILEEQRRTVVTILARKGKEDELEKEEEAAEGETAEGKAE